VYRREGFITLSAPSIPLAAWQLGSRRDLDAAISRPISVQRSEMSVPFATRKKWIHSS
jgi:hypothetical protein